MFESLTEYVSGSPWTYAFLFAVSALDVVFPVVPSEASVITAGVLASSGDLILVLVIVLAAAGAILGNEYNVLEQLNLPRIPVEEGDLATGGAIALALALLTTLLGAILGGAKGRHYHDRVDHAALR